MRLQPSHQATARLVAKRANLSTRLRLWRNRVAGAPRQRLASRRLGQIQGQAEGVVMALQALGKPIEEIAPWAELAQDAARVEATAHEAGAALTRRALTTAERHPERAAELAGLLLRGTEAEILALLTEIHHGTRPQLSQAG